LKATSVITKSFPEPIVTWVVTQSDAQMNDSAMSLISEYPMSYQRWWCQTLYRISDIFNIQHVQNSVTSIMFNILCVLLLIHTCRLLETERSTLVCDDSTYIRGFLHSLQAWGAFKKVQPLRVGSEPPSETETPTLHQTRYSSYAYFFYKYQIVLNEQYHISTKNLLAKQAFLHLIAVAMSKIIFKGTVSPNYKSLKLV
jgi:hypothetical protein